MAFTNSKATIRNIDADTEGGALKVYTVDGVYCGEFSSADAIKAALPQGVPTYPAGCLERVAVEVNLQ